MNSTQALDYALRIVRGHRVSTSAALEFKEDAITTLEALREVVIDNDRQLAEQREEVADSRPTPRRPV